MTGEQREFIVIVKDRRARGGAVVGKAKALRKFFMDTRQPHKRGVLGTDDGDGSGIGAWVRATGIGGDDAIGIAAQIAERGKAFGGHTGDAFGGLGKGGGAVILARDDHHKVWLAAHGDGMLRRGGKAGGIVADRGRIAVTFGRGNAVAKDDLHPDGAFPAAHGGLIAPSGQGGVIFVVKSDLFKVAHQHVGGEGRVLPPTIPAQQPLAQLGLLHLVEIAAQLGAFLRRGLGHHGGRGRRRVGARDGFQRRFNRGLRGAGGQRGDHSRRADPSCSPQPLPYHIARSRL